MKTLTDEQVVRVLAERDGLKQMRDIPHRPCGYESSAYDDWWYGYKSEFNWCAWRTPPYLESRDALAPVLAGLSEEEWFDLATILVKKHPSLPSLSEDVKWLLTLPPADLARAVASVLVEQPEESA